MKLIGTSNPQKRDTLTSICSQALWTVQNLSFNKEICQELIVKHNLLTIPQALFLEYFIEDDQSKPGYAKQSPKQLTAVDIEFIRELLWFTSNVSADSDDTIYYLLTNGLA